jgi:hypothetical protein
MRTILSVPLAAILAALSACTPRPANVYDVRFENGTNETLWLKVTTEENDEDLPVLLGSRTDKTFGLSTGSIPKAVMAWTEPHVPGQVPDPKHQLVVRMDRDSLEAINLRTICYMLEGPDTLLVYGIPYAEHP